MPAAPPDESLSEAPTLPQRVRDVLHAAAAPLEFPKVKAALKAAGVAVTGKRKVTDEQIQQELQGEGVHEHPAAGKGKPKYWHKPPETVAEKMEATVRAKLDALGEKLATLSQLGKPKTGDGVIAFDAILARLLDEGKLHKVGAKFTTKEPSRPKWYDSAPHKANYDKLAALAVKLVGTGAVTLDQIVATLREKFGATPAVAEPPVVSKAAEVPRDAPPPVVEAAPDLGVALKAAYDHLCKFAEFKDRLVELPRLYHETRRRMPTVSVEAYHDELTRLSKAYRIELHVLNEASTAEEPHLAIARNDRLYYYARWK